MKRKAIKLKVLFIFFVVVGVLAGVVTAERWEKT